ncbi:hypothetical protein SPRI_4552 [Streptomyces pristinaespiralis]|nr:hypothetical protein SPRI_4552 [Streptomyces pristinaespiralis]
MARFPGRAEQAGRSEPTESAAGRPGALDAIACQRPSGSAEGFYRPWAPKARSRRSGGSQTASSARSGRRSP